MRPLLIAAIAAIAAASGLMAQSGTGRFQYERTIEAANDQQRLDIDVPLLSGSQPFTVTASGDRASGLIGCRTP